MVYKNDAKVNAYYNKKWLERDSEEKAHKRHTNALNIAKKFNGISPQLELEKDQIDWKKQTKYGITDA